MFARFTESQLEWQYLCKTTFIMVIVYYANKKLGESYDPWLQNLVR